nr:hypothetical protein Iba_chr10eCG1820 [Ipomoea batatas]
MGREGNQQIHEGSNDIAVIGFSVDFEITSQEFFKKLPIQNFFDFIFTAVIMPFRAQPFDDFLDGVIVRGGGGVVIGGENGVVCSEREGFGAADAALPWPCGF